MPYIQEMIGEISDKIVEYSDASKDKWQILADLKGPNMPNPEPRQKIPITLNTKEILDNISDNDIVTICRDSKINELNEITLNNDSVALKEWTKDLSLDSKVDGATKIIIDTYSDQVVDDPNWSENISWVDWKLGGKLSAEDIERALKLIKDPVDIEKPIVIKK